MLGDIDDEVAFRVFTWPHVIQRAANTLHGLLDGAGFDEMAETP
jgi:hypothetical protein